MAHCVEKIAHPKCGSGDGLQVFEEGGKYDGYCFACDTYIPNPYGDQPAGFKPPQPIKKSAEEVEAELAEIRDLGHGSVAKRKLGADALEYFGIKLGFSEVDGVTPTTAYFPYRRAGQVISYKARLLAEKRMWCVGGQPADVELFGWQEAIASGAKRLFITEGEWDAAALWQAIKAKQRGTQWERFNPAVVSLTRGAGHAAKDIANWLPAIRATFKEIVLAFDQDAAGDKATQEVLQLLPQAKTIRLPAKDANACLIEGRELALANAALFSAQEHKTTRIVSATSLFEEAKTPARWGLSWPWRGMTNLTRGIRFGETVYLGAGVKMGKSEVVNTLAAHFIDEHDMPVFLAKPEEANVKTVKLVAGKLVGRHFHDPTIPFDMEAYERATHLMGNKLHLLNLYQYMGWKDLRSDIMAAVHQLGCRAVFIDPITNLVNGQNSGDQNTLLQEIAQELAAMAKDLDIIIFIFCHLKAPLAGEPHERGGKVYSHQFAGSRAMMRSCNMMLGLEGNKDPDLPIEKRNMRRLVILEDREFGVTGYINLFWNSDTGLFSELKGGVKGGITRNQGADQQGQGAVQSAASADGAGPEPEHADHREEEAPYETV